MSRLITLIHKKRDDVAVVSILLACILLSPLALAENIDPTSHFAYGENIGWIDFKPSQGPGVLVCDTTLTGYAYGENIGWIRLDPNYGGVTNDGQGNLSGFAWGENSGWIDFAPTNGGVTINTATGIFYGFAWGENVGWINFTPVNGGVITAWRPSGLHGQDSLRKCRKAMTANELSNTVTSTPNTTTLTSSLSPAQAMTGSAVLSWDLGPEVDLAGYKVYVGTQSHTYDYPGSPFTVGRLTSFTINNLAPGQTYFFAISAYNTSGSNSSLSSEVSKSIF